MMKIALTFHTIFQQLIRPTPRGHLIAQIMEHEQFNSRSAVRDFGLPPRCKSDMSSSEYLSRCRVVVPFRRFGTTYRSLLQGSRGQTISPVYKGQLFSVMKFCTGLLRRRKQQVHRNVVNISV